MIVKLKFNLTQVDQIAKEQVIPLLKKYSIVTFTGPLGAGKTTLIRSVLRQCGVSEGVTSPTFGYVNSYTVVGGHADTGFVDNDPVRNGVTYNHFDLYRIASVNEFMMLGFDEYFAKKDSVSFIEWPEVISSLLASDELKSKICDIKIDYIPDDVLSRVIQISTWK